MQIITLYKRERSDGGVTISTKKPPIGNITEMCRLIADEGKLLTKDGSNTFPCVDVESSEGWYEVDEPKEGENIDPNEATDKDYQAALTDLGVKFDEENNIE